MPSPCFASQMGMSGHHSLSIPGNLWALGWDSGTGGEGTVGAVGFPCTPHLVCVLISRQLSS